MKTLLFSLSLLLTLQTAQAQLANPSFENWAVVPGSGGYITPNGWTINGICYQSTATTSGSYALQISVWYYYSKTTAAQSAPISYRPYAFTGNYTYTNNVMRNIDSSALMTDTAKAKVWATRWNASTMQRDTLGAGSLAFVNSSTYQRFVCPIVYTSSGTPDSVTVLLDPSLLSTDGYSLISVDTTGKNSFLTTDDLALPLSPTSIPTVADASEICIYPNPASSTLQLHREANTYSEVAIYDITGRIVLRTTTHAAHTAIHIATLQPGVYLLSATDPVTHSAVTLPFKKQ